MDKDQLSRKLTVILHADVVGSTSLVQKDEALAHQRIQDVFSNFSKTIDSYGGVTQEIRGDALIAQFERASDSVSAAITFQKINEDYNLTLEDQIRPELRIGISLGEVIVADNTITGEGVVLAQRLEQIAEPGGVVVQGSVSETVPSRIPFEFISLGKQTLKGFDQPVRAFAANIRVGEEIPTPEKDTSLETIESGRPKDYTMLLPDSYEVLIGERLELPKTPSIAVLPFLNMSNDPEQEFFADGMAEEIITSLSRVPDLIVIARNSTFVYKGRAVDVRQVGQELAVHHVLEGSIRKSGDRIRITAQLVDTQNGNHIWAERYDRTIDDIFAIQDEITHAIVVELHMKLVSGETNSSSTKSVDAWELLVRANQLLELESKYETNLAKQLLKQALEIDNQYSNAWLSLGWVYWQESESNWSSDSEKSMQLALDAAKKALSIDNNAYSYGLLSFVYLSLGDLDQAIEMCEKGLELAPFDPENLVLSAIVFFEIGRVTEGIKNVQKAIRRCPVTPAWFFSVLGIGFQLNGDNKLALLALEQAIKSEPTLWIARIWLASAFINLNRFDDAIEMAKEILEIEPSFSVNQWVQQFNTRSCKQIQANLLAAGLPE